MDPKHRIWLGRATIVLAALAILYFAWKLLVLLVARAVGILMFLVNVLFLPAVVFVLGWFAYSVFLKRYVRARRIAKIRNARYLREAVQRGDSERHSEESTKPVEDD